MIAHGGMDVFMSDSSLGSIQQTLSYKYSCGGYQLPLPSKNDYRSLPGKHPGTHFARWMKSAHSWLHAQAGLN